MGMMDMNMSGFAMKVGALILGALVLMVALQVFPMVVDIANDLNLMTKSSAVWETSGGKRFDRVMLQTTTIKNAYDASGANASTLWVTPNTNGTIAHACTDGAVTVRLPGDQQLAGTCASNVITVTGVKAATPLRFLAKNVGLIGIVVAAVALIVSLAPLGMLAGVGYMFLGRFFAGMGTMTKVIVSVIGVVIGGTVLLTFVEFIDVAYSAINGHRFTVYGSGLGSLSTVITDFWGVIMVIGLMILGSVFTFQGVQRYRASRRGGMGGGGSAMSA